jgi:L-alanine-DL-glutamate epimerase-like enolase superfamily enzyme
MESMLRAGAVDVCQPSVIKVGGIEAVAQAVTLARAHGVDNVPHCFYFGPGFLASLHLAAAFAPEAPFELFFGNLQASPYHDAVRARVGQVTVPCGAGLGVEPAMAVIDRFRMGAPIVIGR